MLCLRSSPQLFCSRNRPRRHAGIIIGMAPSTGTPRAAIIGMVIARTAFAWRNGVRVARSGGRPSAWCGWWLGNHLGMNKRDLWLARNWASVGSNAGGPGIGVVVVWRHHVGLITGRSGSGWIVKSGNDGNRVRERVRSISGAIAFRHVGGGANVGS